MGHGHIVVQAAISSTSQTEKIILFNLAQTTKEWSPFQWLENGHRLNATIDRLLSCLERAGALQDENHIFRFETTNQEPSHARRVLRTILLAVQTIKMQGQWEERCDYVMKRSPDLLDSFAAHLEAIVRFVVCNAYLYIQDLDADMNGTPYVDPPFPEHLYEAFVQIVHEAILRLGPSLLLRLLEMEPKFPTRREFLRWLWELYRNGRPLQNCVRTRMTFMLEDLTCRVDVQHAARWLGEHNVFGIKYAGDLDLIKWSKAVPEEQAWVSLMHERGWIGPETSVRKLLRLPEPSL